MRSEEVQKRERERERLEKIFRFGAGGSARSKRVRDSGAIRIPNMDGGAARAANFT